MEFNGKKIMQESPDTADGLRKDYIDGINSFITRLKEESGKKRQEFMPPERLVEDPEGYRAEYIKMLGLDKLLKTEKPSECVLSGKDDFGEFYRLTVYITDEIPFYAMIFIPFGAKNAPLVIAQHGGGGTPELCADMNGENNYNHMVRRVMEKGAVVIAPQLLLWSMTESGTMRAHNIPLNRADIDFKLKRFGLSITALEIKGIMKCIDYGLTLKEVNGDKVMMTGLSYGGYFTLHTMAADTRIKAGYTAACFNDRHSYPWQDFTYPSSAIKFHDAEVAALCAPRKLFIQVGKQDAVFNYETAVSEAERIKAYYEAYGCPENLRFSVWDGGHTFPDDDEGFDFIFK